MLNPRSQRKTPAGEGGNGVLYKPSPWTHRVGTINVEINEDSFELGLSSRKEPDVALHTTMWECPAVAPTIPTRSFPSLCSIYIY